MNDDLDVRLLARFAEVRARTLDGQFLATVLVRLETARRRSLYRQAALGGAALLLLAWQLPALLALTARLADGMVLNLVVPTVQAVAAPVWVMACWGMSLLVGALVLWRAPLRRRR